MRRKLVDIAVGLFMLAGMIALLMLAIKVSGVSAYMKDYYVLTADFDNIGGLKPGAAVTMAGVKVGEVDSISLEKETFRAHAVLHISRANNRLPVDTSASILTEGILGSNYVALTPGFDVDEVMKNGDEIATTHSALILENLIGQLVFSLQGDKNKKEEKETKKEANVARVNEVNPG